MNPQIARLARAVRWMVIGAALLAYPVLAHYATATGAASLAAALAIFPLAAVACGMAWRSPRRGPMLALCGLALAALAVFWNPLRQNFGWIYFCQHVGTHLALCLLFGRSLLDGQQSLCAQISALVHGPLSAQRARYARHATVAWAVYFAIMAAVSAVLFFLAPITVWSVFANLLTPLLAVLMFVAEYLLRRRLLPTERHGSLWVAARAFRNRPGASAAPTQDAGPC